MIGTYRIDTTMLQIHSELIKVTETKISSTISKHIKNYLFFLTDLHINLKRYRFKHINLLVQSLATARIQNLSP